MADQSISYEEFLSERFQTEFRFVSNNFSLAEFFHQK